MYTPKAYVWRACVRSSVKQPATSRPGLGMPFDYSTDSKQKLVTASHSALNDGHTAVSDVAGSATGKNVLSVEDLRVSFPVQGGDLRAVDGLNFEVREGEILALVGESGCGKSVTARAILRLVKPPGVIGKSSRIYFNDTDVMSLDRANLRQLRGREIGMVFQDSLAALNPFYTIRAQIRAVLKAHHAGNEPESAVIDVLRRIGFSDPAQILRRYPHELSGGMRQRVALAMSTILHPTVLIADEATTALDVSVQAQVLEFLVGLRDTYGTSILLITHDLGVVAEIADRVAVMYAGRMMEEAPTTAIIQHPAHPYTKALMDAIPKIGDVNPPAGLGGEVPVITGDWVGCRFAGRCARSTSKCVEIEPGLIPLGEQRAACWHPLVEPAAPPPSRSRRWGT